MGDFEHVGEQESGPTTCSTSSCPDDRRALRQLDAAQQQVVDHAGGDQVGRGAGEQDREPARLRPLAGGPHPHTPASARVTAARRLDSIVKKLTKFTTTVGRCEPCGVAEARAFEDGHRELVRDGGEEG